MSKRTAPTRGNHVATAAIWTTVLVATALIIGFAPGAQGATQKASSASGSADVSASASSVSGSTAAAKSASSATSAASSTSAEVAVDDGTCLICHTSTDMLTEAGLPDGADASAYLVSDAFLQDEVHGSMTCITCHSGDDTATTKDAAHDGMTTDPSDTTMSGTCGVAGCHDDKASTFEDSLHHTDAGLYTGFVKCLRGQDNGQDLVDQHFDTDCYSCHATCGQCHVSTPTAYGGGLIRGHVFVRGGTQDIDDKTCLPCHSELGDYAGTDVHHADGMGCAQCHKTGEFHGSDLTNDATNYHDATTANCLECHEDVVGTGTMTEEHLANVTCTACHDQPYDTCYNCHEVDCDIVSQVKLGYGTDGKLHTLMHVPVSHLMYNEEWGTTLDADKLGTMSTWAEISEHTVQIAVPDQDFCDKCHGAGTDLLTEDDLVYPDQEEQYVVAPLEEEKASALASTSASGSASVSASASNSASASTSK